MTEERGARRAAVARAYYEPVRHSYDFRPGPSSDINPVAVIAVLIAVLAVAGTVIFLVGTLISSAVTHLNDVNDVQSPSAQGALSEITPNTQQVSPSASQLEQTAQPAPTKELTPAPAGGSIPGGWLGLGLLALLAVFAAAVLGQVIGTLLRASFTLIYKFAPFWVLAGSVLAALDAFLWRGVGVRTANDALLSLKPALLYVAQGAGFAIAGALALGTIKWIVENTWRWRDISDGAVALLDLPFVSEIKMIVVTLVWTIARSLFTSLLRLAAIAASAFVLAVALAFLASLLRLGPQFGAAPWLLIAAGATAIGAATEAFLSMRGYLSAKSSYLIDMLSKQGPGVDVLQGASIDRLQFYVVVLRVAGGAAFASELCLQIIAFGLATWGADIALPNMDLFAGGAVTPWSVILFWADQALGLVELQGAFGIALSPLTPNHAVWALGAAIVFFNMVLVALIVRLFTNALSIKAADVSPRLAQAMKSAAKGNVRDT